MVSALDLTNTYKIQEDIMTFMGVWHIRNFTLFNRFMRVFSTTVFLIAYSGMILQFIYSITDFEELSQSLCIMTSYTTYFCKLLGYSYKRNTFLHMLDYLKDPIFLSHPPRLEIHLSRTMARSILITKIYRFSCFSVVGLFIIYPLLDNKSLPSPIPFDMGKYTPVVYVIQSLGIFIAAANNFCLDTLCTSLMGLAYSELNVLREKIIEIKEFAAERIGSYGGGVNEKIDAMVMAMLRNCISHHCAIIMCVEQIEEVFSFGLLFQFLGSVIVICNTGFFLLMASPASFQFVMFTVYFVTMMIQLSLYCWYGNEIVLKSAEIRDACYFSEWYSCGIGVRKLLFIMMERSKRPLFVTAWKFSTLSLSAFISIIQWSYSYLALLQRLASKRGLLK